MDLAVKNRIKKIKSRKIPTGYKYIKIGVIPFDWEEKILGELGEFKKGREVSTGNTVDNGLPAMMYGDIYVKYNYCFDKVDYRITMETAEKSTKVYKNDLLFTCSGETAIEIGKCVCYQGTDTIYIGGDILAFTPHKDNALFLMYQQNIFPLIKQKARFGQGNSVVHIYKESIEKLCVVKPKDTNEQQRIAEILGTWDKAIELKEKLIEKLETRKKWYISKFIKNRTASSLIKLGDILTETLAVNNENLTIYSVAVEKGIVNQMEHLGRSFAAKDTSKYSKVCFGDIVYTKSPTGHFPYGIIKQSRIKHDVAVSPLYGVFRPISFSVGYILHSLYENPKFVNVFLHPLIQKGAKNTMNISNDTFLNGKLFFPKKDECQHIADILSTADKEIDLHKSELEKIKLQKKSLMQLLLTGIVRTI